MATGELAPTDELDRARQVDELPKELQRTRTTHGVSIWVFPFVKTASFSEVHLLKLDDRPPPTSRDTSGLAANGLIPLIVSLKNQLIKKFQ